MSYQSQPQSQSQQLYPVLPTTYSYQIQQQPMNINTNMQQQTQSTPMPPQYSATAPLLEQQTTRVIYPIYHPKRAVYYARRSRGNCCRVCTCVICCTLLVLGALIGTIVGVLAAECSSLRYTRSDVYSSLATNVSQININSFHGTIKMFPSDSNDDNININVTLKASKEILLDENFKSSFTTDGGIVSLSVEASGNKYWDAINICQDVDIVVYLPAHLFALPSLLITLTNGDIDVNTFGYSFSSVVTTTTNGDIKLSQVVSNIFTCTTTNGDLNVTNILGSGDLTFSTTNGDIYYDAFTLANSAILGVSSTNGDLKTGANGIKCGNSNPITFGTTNGDINVEMFDCTGSFSAHTTSGNVEVIGNNITYTYDNSNDVAGNVGTSGSSSLTAGSTNGDIYINFN